MLGIGGMQLYRAETPGPVKDERIAPRIAGTARSLCVVYVWMTAACALCYWIAGMSLFDAIAHSFATLATGGYSTHDASFAWFDSRAIEAVAIVFMLLAGISFNLHFMAWRTWSIAGYLRNTQTRVFLIVVALLTAVMALTLYQSGAKGTMPEAFRAAAFTVASVITNTGFGTGVDWRPNPGIAFPAYGNWLPVTRAVPEPPSIRNTFGGPAIGPIPYPGAPAYGAPLYAPDGTPLWPGLPPAPPPGAPRDPGPTPGSEPFVVTAPGVQPTPLPPRPAKASNSEANSRLPWAAI